MQTLNQENQTSEVQLRIINILRTLINETEATGASSVVPHGALQKGETFEVTVKNENVTQITGEMQVQVCTNTTLWELKQEVARVMDFTPKYIRMGIGKQIQNRVYYTD